MLYTTFRTALRSLRRNRGFALLNVGGLALGLACVVLIALYVQDERGFDRYHERADRIVRVDTDFIQDGVVEPSGNTQGILAPALEEHLPQVEATVRFTYADDVLRVGDRAFQAGEVLLADASVFEVFSWPLLQGDPATALAAPGQIVLTEALARQLFGDAPAMDQTVRWRKSDLAVSGVMADVPRQSHLAFDALIALDTVEDPGWYYTNWFSVNFTTYALLREGVSPEAFDAALPAFLERVAGEAMRAEGQGLALHARPLRTLYLTADRGMGTFGDGTTLQVLALVALFVLVVAAVNFTNLATARSVDRAREVGVRKAIGAGRAGLALQFLAEAVLLSAAAALLAVGLAWLALPAFQALSGKPLSLADLGWGWAWIAALALGTGLLAGAYPALVLSGFRPAVVLKGRFATGRRGKALRQGLVVGQFAVSVALIAATSIVFAQLRHVQSRDLGLDLGGAETQLLVVPFMGDSTVVANLPEIRARLAAVPGVVGATTSLTTPTYGVYSAGGGVEQPDGAFKELSVAMYMADTAYADVYGLTLLAGTRADERTGDRPRAYVLNETAVRAAGYADPASALGAQAGFWGMTGEVVGVVRDFHVEGLQKAVEPLALTVGLNTELFAANVLTVRVRTAALPETLAAIQALWADAAPSRPFEYSFLDDDFAEQYAAERRFGRLFGAFSGLAILISCLGLFGLTAHAAAQRTKEIGVRRVLGASVAQVVALLGRDVVGLVGVGVLLAVPVVWVGMSRWLDGFAYRIPMSPVPLVSAALIVLAFALAVVAAHAVRAATADPVRALRSE